MRRRPPGSRIPPGCGPRQWPPACCRGRSAMGGWRCAGRRRPPPNLQFLQRDPRDGRGLRAPAPPSGRRSARDRRPATARSVPAASRSARRRRGPGPARPRITTGRSKQGEDRRLARAHHGRQQLPAGERLAGGRQVATRHIRPPASGRPTAPAAPATSDTPSAAAACNLRPSGPTAAIPRRSAGWTPPGRRTDRCGPASAASGEKTSRMPPRTEYSPTISTGSRRS